MEMLREIYRIGFDNGLGIGKDEQRFDQIAARYGVEATE